MKILICDDHKIVREGLKQILQQLEGTIYIDEAANGNEALMFIEKEIFDIMLLDITLPGRNGLEVLSAVKIMQPAINILMLSMHPQEQYAIRALKLGASGYLTKDTASEELLQAVKKISEGGKYISNSLAESMAFFINNDSNIHKHQLLSDREFEIMIGIANGKSLMAIGKEFCISDKTVSTYRSRILKKMNLNRNTEIARYCLENNLI